MSAPCPIATRHKLDRLFDLYLSEQRRQRAIAAGGVNRTAEFARRAFAEVRHGFDFMSDHPAYRLSGARLEAPWEAPR
jgi:hypothetical protein